MRSLVYAVFLFWSCCGAAKAAVDGFALADAAQRQVGVTVRYDGAYRALAYPGGDVPIDRGVCTDVVVRAYRRFGIDLQVLVHEDIERNWHAYPRIWAQKRPDRNIDHRRVPNLATFFARHGEALAVSHDPAHYRPGDVVTWRLPSGVPHIGLVAASSGAGGRPLMIHNIGRGTQAEDVLFAYEITGHYRYFPGAKPGETQPRPTSPRS